MGNNPQNVNGQVPLKVSLSDYQNAIFMLEVLDEKGLEIQDVLDGKVPVPDTFTRSEMYSIALRNGDKYFRNYFGKQKTDRGLLGLAAATGKSVEYYRDLLEYPVQYTRFGIQVVKFTKVTCKSVQNKVLFDPKMYTAPDGEIHYRTDWLWSSLCEVERKMGREVFLARAEAIPMDTVDGELKEENLGD